MDGVLDRLENGGKEGVADNHYLAGVGGVAIAPLQELEAVEGYGCEGDKGAVDIFAAAADGTHRRVGADGADGVSGQFVEGDGDVVDAGVAQTATLAIVDEGDADTAAAIGVELETEGVPGVQVGRVDVEGVERVGKSVIIGVARRAEEHGEVVVILGLQREAEGDAVAVEGQLDGGGGEPRTVGIVGDVAVGFHAVVAAIVVSAVGAAPFVVDPANGGTDYPACQAVLNLILIAFEVLAVGESGDDVARLHVDDKSGLMRTVDVDYSEGQSVGTGGSIYYCDCGARGNYGAIQQGTVPAVGEAGGVAVEDDAVVHCVADVGGRGASDADIQVVADGDEMRCGVAAEGVGGDEGDGVRTHDVVDQRPLVAGCRRLVEQRGVPAVSQAGSVAVKQGGAEADGIDVSNGADGSCDSHHRRHRIFHQQRYLDIVDVAFVIRCAVWQN